MLRTKAAVLAEADSILHNKSYGKEDGARVSGLLELAAVLPEDNRNEVQPGRRTQLQSRLPVDPEFRAYLTLGRDGLDPDRRAAAARKIQAAMTTTDAQGGYLVPQSFAQSVTDLLAQYDQLFDVATLYQTDTGRACGFPLTDDASVGAAVVAESGSSNQSADEAFGNIAFPAASTWRTGLITASTELAQDSAFDLQGLLARAFARRFAKGCGAAAVTQLLSGSTAGATTASPTAIAASEVFDLVSSVDDAYSNNPGTGFLMRRSTLTAIRKLVGTSGNFMFEAERDGNGNPLLLGYRVYISPSMGDLTATAKSVAFGDLSMVIQRTVRDSMIVKTYVERFAEYGQVAFEGFLRADFRIAKSASVLPVKFLQQHS